MKKNKSITIIVIITLSITVFIITVGYSKLSAHLIIDPESKVEPTNVFNVRLSSDSNSFVYGSVYADKIQSNVFTNGYENEYGSTATISSDGKTLNNIKAYFSVPGQSVVYTFYAVNGVGYNAYLDKVTFTQVNNRCTIPNDSQASSSLVQEACRNIKISIKIGDEDYWTYENDTRDIRNHYIPASRNLENLSSETIKVKIDYLGNKVANGKFEVNLGSIKLNYTTVVKNS